MQSVNPLKVQKWSKANQVDAANFGATMNQLVPFDQHRVALVISNTTGAALNLSLTPGGDGSFGIVIPASGAPLILTLAQHGGMVFGPIYGINVGGAANVSYWESHNLDYCKPDSVGD